jgi:hypothetical protein
MAKLGKPVQNLIARDRVVERVLSAGEDVISACDRELGKMAPAWFVNSVRSALDQHQPAT